MLLKSIFLSLALMTAAVGSEIYSPFGLTLGANAYEVEGFPNVKRLVDLGYSAPGPFCTLEGQPITGQDGYHAWELVHIQENARILVASRHPELSQATVETLQRTRKAEGGNVARLVFITPDRKRSVSVQFLGSTGTIVFITASLTGGMNESADLKAAASAMIRGCAGFTDDGQCVLGGVGIGRMGPEQAIATLSRILDSNGNGELVITNQLSKKTSKNPSGVNEVGAMQIKAIRDEDEIRISLMMELRKDDPLSTDGIRLQKKIQEAYAEILKGHEKTGDPGGF